MSDFVIDFHFCDYCVARRPGQVQVAAHRGAVVWDTNVVLNTNIVSVIIIGISGIEKRAISKARSDKNNPSINEIVTVSLDNSSPPKTKKFIRIPYFAAGSISCKRSGDFDQLM